MGQWLWLALVCFFAFAILVTVVSNLCRHCFYIHDESCILQAPKWQDAGQLDRASGCVFKSNFVKSKQRFSCIIGCSKLLPLAHQTLFQVLQWTFTNSILMTYIKLQHRILCCLYASLSWHTYRHASLEFARANQDVFFRTVAETFPWKSLTGQFVSMLVKISHSWFNAQEEVS